MAASTNYDQVLKIGNSQQQGTSATSTAGPVSNRIIGAAVSAGAATIYYLSAVATAAPSATAVPLGLATQACTLKNLYVNMITAPAGSDTCIVHVMTSTDNGATFTASTLTCTVTGTAKSNSDTTHFVSLAAGGLVAIRINNSATTGAGVTASFEMA